MHQIRTVIILIFLFQNLNSYSQNRIQAQEYISDLCTDQMAGRGYINKGDSIAAEYIKEQFQEIGLSPLADNFYHSFQLDVNTIEKCHLTLNGKSMKPGIEFAVGPSSPSSSYKGELFIITQEMLLEKKIAKKVKKAVRKGLIPVFAPYDRKNEKVAESIKEIEECAKLELKVFMRSPLTWTVGRTQTTNAELWLDPELNLKDGDYIELDVQSQFIENYQSQNVAAYIPGTLYPDSFIILCGHYDHLGKMGSAIYYGANDNASGIAMIMDMASYFYRNPQEYSIAFVAFAGEEAGLVGSRNFVYSPPPLCKMDQVKFVFNMDLMGNGEDGATIVNGKVFTSYYNTLVDINQEQEYLPKIKARGKAANSDHYFFSEKGIPSFFIYTMGAYTHYHIPQDNANNLELGPYYDQTFKLLRDFILHFNEVN
ncbi:MAG: M28 family peptidase [Bacteroidia bacterium]